MNEFPAGDDLVELATTLEQVHSSSLMVSVDYLELVDRVGPGEAYRVLGKLKDLLA